MSGQAEKCVPSRRGSITLGKLTLSKATSAVKNSTEIARIRRGDVQTQITEQGMLNLPSGKNVTQWMLAYTQMERLEEVIRGKMHIIIFEASTHES